ncbi:MBL fold metallo-hydrolase [Clostridium thermopalmarium]|uniref:Beta-lactamase superfamily domain protein n=1 Tax=Clostridium thermopalmarium DSM 5974 TaxID=1121340 RepID=A0A2T0AU40_9CLOT|nr:MBL fold metallo-hydrolase [Clostridium thermopalmarium]MBE6043724.1 MBL fold metallo-hydrolase [Clostridium thermopalmarium]PRR73993.1 Beta-lactamase superfamily domain protein [Clostridium thermopalmarium DSM 5974]PVZ20914.1 L-ascorbate metabolism protein UlaG (beta-lactamase superfamily) [Clostridium thermopalmarium DSM 5974]
MNKAKVHYLYHDGFILETASHIFIFDYFNDISDSKERSLDTGVIPDEVFYTQKNIYVLVSHGHEDHFNPLIFNWQNINDKVKYILSSDIEIKDSFPEHRLISKDDSLILDDIIIKAYGSTDIGVSFLIKADNINIFHAGDLNWWHWYDESDEYNSQMAKDFKAEINKLKGVPIDIAFFPVDPRLKEYYYLGGEYFIKNLHPKLFIPMHFENHTEITKNFGKKIKEHDTKIIPIHRRGQEILF